MSTLEVNLTHQHLVFEAVISLAEGTKEEFEALSMFSLIFLNFFPAVFICAYTALRLCGWLCLFQISWTFTKGKKLPKFPHETLGNHEPSFLSGCGYCLVL